MCLVCELVTDLFFLKMNNIYFERLPVVISNMADIDRCTPHIRQLFGVLNNLKEEEVPETKEFEYCYGGCLESGSRKRMSCASLSPADDEWQKAC